MHTMDSTRKQQLYHTGPLLKVHVLSGLFGLAVDGERANKPARLVDVEKRPCIL